MRFYILLFLLVSPLLKSQPIDSLLLVLQRQSSPDTNRVNTLLALAYQHWITGDDSLAKQNSLEAIQLAKKLKFSTGEANARFQIVRIEMDILEDVKAAYAHLDTADQLARETNQPLLEGISNFRRAQLISSVDMDNPAVIDSLFQSALAIFLRAGNLYWESLVYAEQATLVSWEGKYAQAIDLLLKTRQIQESLKDEKALRATLPNLGVTYGHVEMYPEALECFDQAAKIATKNNDVRILAFLHNQRGDIYKKQNRLADARDAYRSAAALYEKTNTTQYLSSAYARLSDIHFQLSQFDASMKYNLKADSVFRSTNHREAIYHYVQINYGNLYLHNKNYQQVVRLAREGLESLQDVNTLLFEQSSYHRQLAEAYHRLGNDAMAYTHLVGYKAASDSLFNDESRQKILAATMGYEFDKMKAEKDLEIQGSENKRLVQARNYLILALLSGLLLIFYVLWVNRRLKKYNAQLIHKNREIEMALDRGQKIERRRVASELHDNLNTKLAALRWSLESIDTAHWDTANQSLHSKLLAMATDAYKDVRLISHNMLPAELETHGLSTALRQLFQKLNELGDIKFRFSETNMDRRLSKNEEHQLYNIVLEAVNNVLKHAQATEVDLQVILHNKQLNLKLSDNGIGMHTVDKQNGMGFHNISNRIESIGGTIQITSIPLQGTSLEVTLPLKETNQKNGS